MIIADIYRPDQWHDFFVMVGTGAAALTGLVFVAMSLNINVVARDATHRYRAIGTLAGFAAVFMICALALMAGQNHVSIGAEWLVVSTIAAVIYVYGYVQAIRKHGDEKGLNVNRVIGGTACYLVEIIGAILLISGFIAGLYMAAVAMVIYFAFMISGAWLLVIVPSQK